MVDGVLASNLSSTQTRSFFHMESGCTLPSPRPSLQQLMTKLNAFAEDYTLVIEDSSVPIDLLHLPGPAGVECITGKLKLVEVMDPNTSS